MYTFGVRVFFIKLDVNSFYQLVFFMTFDVLAHFFLSDLTRLWLFLLHNVIEEVFILEV